MRREDADVASSSARYAERFAGGVGAWFLAVQARLTLELLRDLPPASRLVDVGGGHGQLVEALHGAGHDVTVVGSAPGCGERIADLVAAGACRFETGDLYELPYSDRDFDAALSFRLLPHVRDPRRLIAELCRVARRSVVVDYPSLRSVNVVAGALFEVKRRIEKDTRSFRRFRPGRVSESFSAEGFRVSESRPQFVFPMALHRAHGSAPLARGLEAPFRAVRLTALLGSPVIVRADRVAAGVPSAGRAREVRISPDAGPLA